MMSSANARVAAQYVLGRFASLVRSVDGADSRKGRQRAVMLFEGVAASPAVYTIDLVASIIG